VKNCKDNENIEEIKKLETELNNSFKSYIKYNSQKVKDI
jgi:hypothetical protein